MESMDGSQLKENRGTEENEPGAEEWKNYFLEVTALLGLVLQKAKEKLGADGAEWYAQKIDDLASKIRESSTDWDKYVAYHVLVGSSAPRTMSPRLDFAEPCNVRDFCLKSLAELSLRAGVNIKAM